MTQRIAGKKYGGLGCDVARPDGIRMAGSGNMSLVKRPTGQLLSKDVGLITGASNAIQNRLFVNNGIIDTDNRLFGFIGRE